MRTDICHGMINGHFLVVFKYAFQSVSRQDSGVARGQISHMGSSVGVAHVRVKLTTDDVIELVECHDHFGFFCTFTEELSEFHICSFIIAVGCSMDGSRNSTLAHNLISTGRTGSMVVKWVPSWCARDRTSFFNS